MGISEYKEFVYATAKLLTRNHHRSRKWKKEIGKLSIMSEFECER